jgi:hypothetical protein
MPPSGPAGTWFKHSHQSRNVHPSYLPTPFPCSESRCAAITDPPRSTSGVLFTCILITSPHAFSRYYWKPLNILSDPSRQNNFYFEIYFMDLTNDGLQSTVCMCVWCHSPKKSEFHRFRRVPIGVASFGISANYIDCNQPPFG